jgi:tripartite-type tricarboxylate transporter receptor subunit TctC
MADNRAAPGAPLAGLKAIRASADLTRRPESANFPFGNSRLAVMAALAFMLAMVAGGARAADTAAYYRGKTVDVVVGFSPGGGYDLYARVLARHIGKHLPGSPAVNVQNMPGAGSLKAANYLYNVASKNGTVFGTFDRGLPMERLLGRVEGENFDASRFTWVGNVTDEPSVCGFSARSGIRNWRDMQSKPFRVGGAGATADDQIYPAVLKNLFHVPVRIVSGYPGRAEAVLSIQRGEIDGLCGWSWSSLMSQDRTLYDRGQIVVTLQLGIERSPEIPDLPVLGDLTSDPKEKAALRLIFSRLVLARPFAAPPGVPPERTKALRDAFDATMRDPEYLAEMKRMMLDVRPRNGASVEQMIKELYAYPREVAAIAARAIRD